MVRRRPARGVGPQYPAAPSGRGCLGRRTSGCTPQLCARHRLPLACPRALLPLLTGTLPQGSLEGSWWCPQLPAQRLPLKQGLGSGPRSSVPTTPPHTAVTLRREGQRHSQLGQGARVQTRALPLNTRRPHVPQVCPRLGAGVTCSVTLTLTSRLIRPASLQPCSAGHPCPLS